MNRYGYQKSISRNSQSPESTLNSRPSFPSRAPRAESKLLALLLRRLGRKRLSLAMERIKAVPKVHIGALEIVPILFTRQLKSAFLEILAKGIFRVKDKRNAEMKRATISVFLPNLLHKIHFRVLSNSFSSIKLDSVSKQTQRRQL